MNKASRLSIFSLFILIGCLVVNGERECPSFCSALGMLSTSPGKSCNDIYQINKATRGKSGNYWIQINNETAQEVYCDMELECGGHKGGWMRLADLDTTNGDTCPGAWINNANYNSLCTGTGGVGCYSATFLVPYSYNKICGQVRGFQKGTPNGFYPYFFSRGSAPSDLYVPVSHSTTVDGVYVDGVSITLGQPRKHVWTYAIGLNDDFGGADPDYGLGYFNCPCTKVAAVGTPVFVDNNYYCESGNGAGLIVHGTLYTEDVLWDGEQCNPGNSCCDRIGQPWFLRQLPISEKEDLEVRICQDQDEDNEAITVEKLQLFIQ